MDWWERPILTDRRGIPFSRRDLVLAVANKDGGAHIDADLGERYRGLSRENSLGFVQDDERPIANSVVLASVRQVADELLRTVETGLEWFDDEARVAHPICSLPVTTAAKGDSDGPCLCGSGLQKRQCFELRKPLHQMSDLEPGAISDPKQPDVPVLAANPEPPSVVLDSLILQPIDEVSGDRHGRKGVRSK
jgi:hypothetical protein